MVSKIVSKRNAEKKIKENLHLKDRRGEFLSDIILGGQDGLVNTLGVILGIAAASAELRIIVAGGLAGAIAEAISMGAVGYTSKVAERDFYLSQLQREKMEIRALPEEEKLHLKRLYRAKGFKGHILDEVVKVISSDEKLWLRTIMMEELSLTPVEDNRPWIAAFWVGISALIGALVPLSVFILMYLMQIDFAEFKFNGIISSLVFSAFVLFLMGWYKAKLTSDRWYRGGLQIMLIGMVSALAGYLIGSLFNL